jgi:uncharacterized iron-regulated membrane protein
VDQVALPFRIALLAILAAGAVWFVALRPKTDSASTTTPPGVTGLANDVQKAKDATSTATSTPSQTTTGTTSTPTTSTDTKATPATNALLEGVGTKDPSRPILQAVSTGRVAVMLFWNSKASDDRAVRQAVLAVDKHSGKVLTRIISVSKVGSYEAITRGVDVQGSPTVVIINRKGEARTIVGYTTKGEIDQAVSDLGGKGF